MATNNTGAPPTAPAAAPAATPTAPTTPAVPPATTATAAPAPAAVVAQRDPLAEFKQSIKDEKGRQDIAKRNIFEQNTILRKIREEKKVIDEQRDRLIEQLRQMQVEVAQQRKIATDKQATPVERDTAKAALATIKEDMAEKRVEIAQQSTQSARQSVGAQKILGQREQQEFTLSRSREEQRGATSTQREIERTDKLTTRSLTSELRREQPADPGFEALKAGRQASKMGATGAERKDIEKLTAEFTQLIPIIKMTRKELADTSSIKNLNKELDGVTSDIADVQSEINKLVKATKDQIAASNDTTKSDQERADASDKVTSLEEELVTREDQRGDLQDKRASIDKALIKDTEERAKKERTLSEAESKATDTISKKEKIERDAERRQLEGPSGTRRAVGAVAGAIGGVAQAAGTMIDAQAERATSRYVLEEQRKQAQLNLKSMAVSDLRNAATDATSLLAVGGGQMFGAETPWTKQGTPNKDIEALGEDYAKTNITTKQAAWIAKTGADLAKTTADVVGSGIAGSGGITGPIGGAASLGGAAVKGMARVGVDAITSAPPEVLSMLHVDKGAENIRKMVDSTLLDKKAPPSAVPPPAADAEKRAAEKRYAEQHPYSVPMGGELRGRAPAVTEKDHEKMRAEGIEKPKKESTFASKAGDLITTAGGEGEKATKGLKGMAEGLADATKIFPTIVKRATETVVEVQKLQSAEQQAAQVGRVKERLGMAFGPMMQKYLDVQPTQLQTLRSRSMSGGEREKYERDLEKFSVDKDLGARGFGVSEVLSRTSQVATGLGRFGAGGVNERVAKEAMIIQAAGLGPADKSAQAMVKMKAGGVEDPVALFTKAVSEGMKNGLQDSRQIQELVDAMTDTSAGVGDMPGRLKGLLEYSGSGRANDVVTSRAAAMSAEERMSGKTGTWRDVVKVDTVSKAAQGASAAAEALGTKFNKGKKLDREDMTTLQNLSGMEPAVIESPVGEASLTTGAKKAIEATGVSVKDYLSNLATQLRTKGTSGDINNAMQSPELAEFWRNAETPAGLKAIKEKYQNNPEAMKDIVSKSVSGAAQNDTPAGALGAGQKAIAALGAAGLDTKGLGVQASFVPKSRAQAIADSSPSGAVAEARAGAQAGVEQVDMTNMIDKTRGPGGESGVTGLLSGVVPQYKKQQDELMGQVAGTTTVKAETLKENEVAGLDDAIAKIVKGLGEIKDSFKNMMPNEVSITTQGTINLQGQSITGVVIDDTSKAAMGALGAAIVEGANAKMGDKGTPSVTAASIKPSSGKSPAIPGTPQ